MRLQGWEARLATVLEAARARPYQLGAHDCFRVVCATIEALTGVDRWPEFSGRYGSKREALVLIATYGSSFDAAFSRFFCGEPVPSAQARQGDAVKFIDDAGEAHLGVCVDAAVAVLGEHGLAFMPRSRCDKAWRIG